MDAKHSASSLWDLLQADLQLHIIELSLELRKTKARKQYQMIRMRSLERPDEGSYEDIFPSLAAFALGHLVKELQSIVSEIHADEQCLLAFSEDEQDEMLELHASLQKLIEPSGLDLSYVDWSDIDWEELFGP